MAKSNGHYDAVALTTNVTLSMERGTKEAGGTRLQVGGTRLRVTQAVQHAG